MAQPTKPKGDEVPLPDPDLLQKSLDKAVDDFRRRPGLYAAGGILLLAVVVALIIILNRPTERSGTEFNRLWMHCQPVRNRLARDLSAEKELQALEDYLEEIRGTTEEGYALWLLGVYHYREAHTSDKAGFDQQRPHLEKAVSYFGELEDARFDDLLLAKPRWFTGEQTIPTEAMLTQAEADLEWAKKHALAEPKPEDDTVAVLRTAEGDIYLKFFQSLAPNHVENFLKLATAGFYNGTQFHFVRGGNVEPTGVMAGDPYTFFYPDPLKEEHILRWGSGGLGFDLPPEEARFKIVHQKGIVTSQRVEKADWDNAAQFQILLSTDRALDRVHTPFAQVVEGIGLVEKIARRKTASQHDPFKGKPAFSGAGARDLLVEPTVIHKVIVYRDGKAVEHGYPLEDGEKTLETLSGTKAAALPKEAIYSGRLMFAVDSPASKREEAALPVPFPEDVDAEKAEPKGERD